MDNNLDDNLNDDLDDTGYDSNGVAGSSKGKRLMRFRNHLTKKLKLSLSEVFLEGNTIKNEIKKKALDFSITKWEKEMEEKQRQSKIEEEQKRRDHEVALKQANAEGMITKSALIKSLYDLGVSQDEILEQLKDL